MKLSMIKIGIVVFAIALGFGIMAGCSSMEPYEYKDEAEEMEGRGLITGEEGEKTIFRIPADSKNQTEETQAADTNKEVPESERIIQP